MKTLVLGIGNSLLADEGAGVHVIRLLQDRPSEASRQNAGHPVEYLDGGTLSFTLAGAIHDADGLIVVDAAQLHAEPGTVQVFETDEMDRFLTGQRKASVHEVGLVDLMAIARLGGYWPARRALVAIQPEAVDWGESPTPRVAAALPEACRRIEALLRGWGHAA